MKKFVLGFIFVFLFFCMNVLLGFQQSAEANSSVQMSDSAKLASFYNALATCSRRNYTTPYGDMRIQKKGNGICYYSTTFQGTTFECNFPNEAANKYSKYKRMVHLTKLSYARMKEIEKNYCHTK